MRLFLRPHLLPFLAGAAEFADVLAFTSATEGYAREVVRRLDPGSSLLTHVFSRDHCTELDKGVFAKDLASLGRPLARTVLVDDTKSSFLLQPDNGILVSPFFGDEADEALPSLLAVLRSLAALPDVRPVLQREYGLRRRLELQEHLRSYSL